MHYVMHYVMTILDITELREAGAFLWPRLHSVCSSMAVGFGRIVENNDLSDRNVFPKKLNHLCKNYF